MNKMIKIDVVELGVINSNRGIYINNGVKTILINPNVIAEIWPVKKVDLAKKTNIMNDREKIVGSLDVALLYTTCQHSVANNGDLALKFITPESYDKLVSLYSQSKGEDK